jgi:crossover junction endodeoxyribonuclease RusA
VRELFYRLPWPPSVNHLYRRERRGVRLSDKAREYYRNVSRALPVGVVERLEGRLRVYITLHAPDGRLRDLDNPMKATLDGCTKACVWRDDSQIDELHIARGLPDPDKRGFVDMLIVTD